MTPCILSTGRSHTRGYAWARGGKLAHRVAWEEAHGPIPAGKVIDHVCHNLDSTCLGGDTCAHRRCVNIEHLALSTSGQNVRDGILGRAFCKAGIHPKDELGECILCRDARNAAYYAAHIDELRAASREKQREKRALAARRRAESV